MPRSLFVHRSRGGYFRRLGSSKREMSPEALERLFRDRGQSRAIRFDETAVPRTAPGALDYALTRRFLRDDAGEAGVSETTARKLRLVTDDDGEARLTLAGVLLCTREPQRWLPHAYVQAVSYAGERTDVDYRTDARDVGGPLDEQAADALHFVRRNMLVRATKATARTEHPQFSERAVFEALVNAVAHRDYSLAGRGEDPASGLTPVRGRSSPLSGRARPGEPRQGRHLPAGPADRRHQRADRADGRDSGRVDPRRARLKGRQRAGRIGPPAGRAVPPTRWPFAFQSFNAQNSPAR